MSDYTNEPAPWSLYKDNITSIIIEDEITSVGNNCFSECIGLNSVIIPNNITRINEYTFFNCSLLKNIYLPNSVTSIGSFAFLSSNLTTVIISNSQIEIGKCAFGFCDSISEFIIQGHKAILGIDCKYNNLLRKKIDQLF